MSNGVDVVRTSSALSVEQMVIEFRTSHAWYKHLIGYTNFYLEPNLDYDPKRNAWRWRLTQGWIRSKRKKRGDSLPLLWSTMQQHPIPISPFIYPTVDDRAFQKLVGRWGYSMFDWLDSNGFEKQSYILRAFVSDNSDVKGARDKATVHQSRSGWIPAFYNSLSYIDSSEVTRTIKCCQVAAPLICTRIRELVSQAIVECFPSQTVTPLIRMIADYALDFVF